MRKITVVVLALFLILGSTVGYAEIHSIQPPIQLYYTHTASITAELKITGGTASCYGEIQPKSGVSSSSITVELQQYKNGKWIPLGSWSGKTSAKGSKSVASGYKYKVIVTGKMMDAKGKVLETVTKSIERSY